MTDYEKLNKIIDEAENLLKENITCSDSVFRAWKTKATRFLIQRFGKDSYEVNQFNKIVFSAYIYTSSTPIEYFIAACKSGLEDAIAVFKTYLEEIEEGVPNSNNITYNNSKIFIVHGHEDALKQEVARLIEKQDIEVIILSDKANQGKTIIEKIENNSNVDCAVCLFTADDMGEEKGTLETKPRARQNVVFEAGYFIGKLGRERVVIIADSEVEMPSDLSGVVYTNRDNWVVDLYKELKAMGFIIDFNKLY